MKFLTVTQPTLMTLWVLSAFSLSALANSHDHGHSPDHGHGHGHSQNQDTRQLGAHVHGMANLLVALEGDHLTITLDTPSINVVGFEHSARHEADRALLLDAQEKLLASDHVFTLTAAAQCRLESVDIASDQLSQLTEAGHGHDDNTGHSEFVVAYHHHCENPTALNSLNIGAFQHFPGFEALSVQWIINGQQGAARAQANRTEVRF